MLELSMNKNTDFSKLTRAELELHCMQLTTELSRVTLENEEHLKTIAWYTEQINLAKKETFGKNKPNTIFNETEHLADEKVEEPKVDEVVKAAKEKTEKRKYKKKAKDKKRINDLSSFETQTIEYTLSGDDLFCDVCKDPLHFIRKQVRQELTIIPARVIVTEHAASIYGCRNCEKNGTATPIIKADTPSAPIYKSIASSSLITDIIINRYENSLPLYRQSQIYDRMGVALSSVNLANWVMKTSERILFHLVNHMKKELLNMSYIYCDETTIDVLRDPSRTKGGKTCYMWVFMSGIGEKHKVVLYHYSPSRAAEVPIDYLAGYEGNVQSDGYAAYKKIPNIVLAGCWSHVRVKYNKVIDSAPKGVDVTKTVSYDILQLIKKLFKVEAEIKKRYFSDSKKTIEQTVYDEIVEIRQEHSKPIVDKIYEIAKGNQHLLPEKGYATAASTYLMNQENCLRVYLNDGRVDISNNAVERAIRPFTVGRNNSYFSDSPRGAEASAICYSLIETLKLNNINAREYINHVLDKLSNVDNITEELLDSMMPWSESMQSQFKLKRKKK